MLGGLLRRLLPAAKDLTRNEKGIMFLEIGI
jgi:hypothetical protein